MPGTIEHLLAALFSDAPRRTRFASLLYTLRRIRLFQLHQLRCESFQVHHLIIEPDSVAAID